MIRFGILLLLFVFAETSTAQNSIDEALQKYNSGSISYISVEQLKAKVVNDENFVLFDTRSKEEYEVSHLKNAIWIGYKKFDRNRVQNIDKDSRIIVYCSVGVRSEKIGEQLKSMGFRNIKNLYGGIFLWVNKGYPVYLEGNQTEEIHTYNKRWEKYITAGKKVN